MAAWWGGARRECDEGSGRSEVADDMILNQNTGRKQDKVLTTDSILHKDSILNTDAIPNKDMMLNKGMVQHMDAMVNKDVMLNKRHSRRIPLFNEYTILGKVMVFNQDSQLNIINPKIYTHMLAGSSIRHSQLAKYE